MTDKAQISPAPMFSEMLERWTACHTGGVLPWITDRDPPGAGTYLVKMAIDDDDNPMVLVRLEHWDGANWDTAGGYVTAIGWYYVPAGVTGFVPR